MRDCGVYTLLQPARVIIIAKRRQHRCINHPLRPPVPDHVIGMTQRDPHLTVIAPDKDQNPVIAPLVPDPPGIEPAGRKIGKPALAPILGLRANRRQYDMHPRLLPRGLQSLRHPRLCLRWQQIGIIADRIGQRRRVGLRKRRNRQPQQQGKQADHGTVLSSDFTAQYRAHLPRTTSQNHRFAFFPFPNPGEVDMPAQDNHCAAKGDPMTTIKLYNTKTRSKQGFTPIDPKNVRIYLCGPTVYDRAHIGNARNVIMFDVLYRLLRHEYGPDHVTYVRNFTDVDDKINAEALRRQNAGESGSLEELIAQRTEETIGWYHADMDALGNLRPDHEPRATQYIPEMIAMTEDLIAKGHAYEAEGHVLFDVRSFPEYGQLSGRSVDDMIAGARVEIAPYKRDPMDFVLWKPSDAETPGWDSPWGRGRPGWHIECSAMSQALLGPSFDIHGGGTDLTFPHHENELAQSCCANPDERFANVWLHNEMLQVEGKKMSKSLGNFFTVRDLLDQGIPGEVIRFVFLQTHYRKTMDWTAEKAKQAENKLNWLYAAVGETEFDERWSPNSKIVEALSNDLNTSQALTYLIEEANLVLPAGHPDASGEHQAAAAELKRSAALLGLLGKKESEWTQSRLHGVEFSVFSKRLADLWSTAKISKDFGPVDAMKKALIEAGLEVRMSNEGVQLVRGPEFDASKLEALL